MPWLKPTSACLLILAALALGLALHSLPAFEPPSETAAGKPSEDAKVVAHGKELFMERCAKCHGERGDWPLKTGLPLNERKLTREVIERNVAGRFKSAPADDKRAVTLYIETLLKK